MQITYQNEETWPRFPCFIFGALLKRDNLRELRVNLRGSPTLVTIRICHGPLLLVARSYFQKRTYAKVCGSLLGSTSPCCTMDGQNKVLIVHSMITLDGLDFFYYTFCRAQTCALSPPSLTGIGISNHLSYVSGNIQLTFRCRLCSKDSDALMLL